MRREALDGGVTRLTGAVALLSGPVSAGCGQAGRSFSGTYCQREGAVADLILDGDDIQHVVCMPSRSESVSSSSASGATARGGARVVSLTEQVALASELADDAGATGDVLLGLGALHSTVEGSLRIDGPDARLRDLTLIGDLRAEVNSSGLALVDVRVFGDLTLDGNSPALIGCEIMGDVVVGKERGVYADVRVAGQWIAPDPVVCVGCASVTPFEPSDATTSDALSNLCAP